MFDAIILLFSSLADTKGNIWMIFILIAIILIIAVIVFIISVVILIFLKKKKHKIIIKKETPVIIKKSIADLNIDVLEGMNDRTILKFKIMKINTMAELQSCNPFMLFKKLNLAFYKVMEYKNKSQALLNLRFDKEIVNDLVKRKYTIQQALEQGIKELDRFANMDKQRVFNFWQSLSQLSMFLSKDAKRLIKIDILKNIAILDTDNEQEIVISKKDERKELERFLSNNKIALLLERMLEGWIRELTPRWQLNTKLGFVYPEAEEVIDPNNIVVNNTLKKLYKVGILERHFFDKVFRCPFCGYPTIILRYSCTRCGSRNLNQEEMIQHYRCGHVDLAKRFKTGDKNICPKCGIELESLGKDYLKPGIMYECQKCGDLSGSVYKRMFCFTCGTILDKDKEILEDIWIYKINNEKRDLLIELLNPKQKIKDLLQKKGFQLKSERIKAGKIQGKSKINHYFDIYAEKYPDNLLIEIATDENQIEIAALYNLFAKARDLGVNYAILFAFPKASEEANNFAKYYNIQILEAEDLTSVISILEDNYDNILKIRFNS